MVMQAGSVHYRPHGRHLIARQALRYLLLAVTWLILWRLSALMEYAPHASIWFPPAGLSFAALLLLGWRAVPVLMVCAVVATFWVDAMYATHAPARELLRSGLWFGSVHCLSYGLGAAVLKRLLKRRNAPAAPMLVILFLGIGCLSALCAALGGIASLQFTGLLAHAAVPGLWLPWWIGDMAGVLVLTPLFLGLLSWRYRSIEPWLGELDFHPVPQAAARYGLKLAVQMAWLAAEMLMAAHLHRPEAAYGMFFLILPQMWIVYTESPFRSALALALFSTATAVWVACLGLIEHSLTYQFAVCVIAANAYFGFAVPALTAQNLALRKQAAHDGLTGAATKSRFFEYAETEVRRARPSIHPVSLIVLDIDRFKHINDDYGHALGDETLKQLSTIVRSQLGPADMFGRFGGDEFMLLLPGCNLRQALALVERLRQQFHRTSVAGTSIRVSACFGAVEIRASETPMQAFRRADMQLLRAKRQRHQRRQAKAV